MARRKRKYISREQKKEFTKELIEANCNIKLLAEKYQVTVGHLVNGEAITTKQKKESNQNRRNIL